MILLYDQACAFCRWAVVWVLDRDRQGVVEPVGIETPRGAELLSDVDEAQRLRSVHVVTGNGARLSGGAALRALLDVLPSRWPSRILGLWPGATDAGYRFVARNRSLFGRLVSSRAKLRADEILRIRAGRQDLPAARRLY